MIQPPHKLTPTHPGLESVTTAARRLGVSPDTIYRAIDDNKLAARKILGRWWVETASLDELLQAPVDHRFETRRRPHPVR